jgi:hypothetical protein
MFASRKTPVVPEGVLHISIVSSHSSSSAKRGVILCLMAAAAGCHGAGEENGVVQMARARIEAGLTLSSSAFTVQHRPMCMWSLKNAGMKALSLDIPFTVSLRVVSARTGVDAVFSPKRAGNVARVRLGRAMELVAGESKGAAFMLDELVPGLPPGAYEISVIVNCGEKSPSAESAPVRVSVLPATPQRLALASVNGGDASYALATWVNCASDPPAVMLSQLAFTSGGGARTFDRVADARLRTAPVVSAPPNQSTASGHWIAWMDGRSIVAVQFDRAKGATERVTLDLDEDGAYLVRPLLAIEPEDDDGPVGGAALVCVPGTGKEPTRLLSVVLTAGELAIDGSLEISGGVPNSIESRVFSDGTRVALFVQEDDEDVILSLAGWPSGTHKGIKQKRLASWSGRAVGAGSMMTDDDEIVGAVLGWMDVTDAEGLEQTELQFVRYTVLQTGTLREGERVQVEWTGPVNEAIVRVNADGYAFALLKDEAVAWSFINDEGQARKFPAPPRSDEEARKPHLRADAYVNPLEIGFMGFEPVIVFGLIDDGLWLTQADGSALPPKFRP